MPHVVNCPKCQGATKILTSRAMSETTREFYVKCKDEDCSVGFSCLIYPTGLLKRSNHVLPPDKDIQPKLFAQRQRTLKLIPKYFSQINE